MTTTETIPRSIEPMMPRPYRVTALRGETEDTVTLDMTAEDGRAMAFAPGQFTMLYLFGVGEVPISISGNPHEPETLTHTVRSVGAVTEAIFGLGVGDPLGVRGPYGVGWPVSQAEGRDLVVAAGGIGLAPLRPVLLDVLERRELFGSVSLIYGARTPADLLYRDQLHSWRSRFDLQVEVTVDQPDSSWLGDVGVVTGLLSRIDFDPNNALAMVCGPEIMMKVVARELLAREVEPQSIHFSLERNMKCAVGFCGHCQLGPDFVCRDGPVLPYHRIINRLTVAET